MIREDFNRIARLALAYRGSRALHAAMREDLFTRIDRGADTPARLGRLGYDPRAVGILLNALCALGLLRKRGERFANTPFARRVLVSGGPAYKGNNIKYQDRMWDAWSELGSVLRTGRPRRKLSQWLQKSAFTDDYIQGMADISRAPAAELARTLDLTGVRRVLDVGCGPGVYAAALAGGRAPIEAVLFDLPGTLKIARGRLGTHPRKERFRFRAGDYREDELGREEFDLVLISHVTHNEDEKTNQSLARKAFRALRPGGRLVVHDFMLDEDRAGPEFSAFFALHMLVFTGTGNVYTVSDYAGWMRRAGLTPRGGIPLAAGSLNPSLALIGRKD